LIEALVRNKPSREPYDFTGFSSAPIKYVIFGVPSTLNRLTVSWKARSAFVTRSCWRKSSNQEVHPAADIRDDGGSPYRSENRMPKWAQG
jgi:hypothetical protein